jgi:cellulose synthase/poly-beta-1,6-N-acetylglucosamine synthase-like glycosyltransferase
MQSSTLKWVDARWFTRLLETIPGLATWFTLIAPILLSLRWPVAVAYFIIGFDLYWMAKSYRMSYYLVRAYQQMRRASQINWQDRLVQLANVEAARSFAQMRRQTAYRRMSAWSWRWHRLLQTKAWHDYQVLVAEEARLTVLAARGHDIFDPSTIYHVVIMATYNESLDILEPSVKALTEADYPLERIIFVLAYEERGGPQTARNAEILMEKYGHRFGMALAVKHPDNLPGEVIGKGGNITYAGRHLAKAIKAQGIAPERVIVTTFDSDHRASRQYFNYLTYEYAIDPERQHKSYQPIPMFYNNIWDVPAAMRVLATGNSFWILIEMMRPNRLRNFAAHAQCLAALIDTDFWSVTTIVEDGHQYWRTYFRYSGQHYVVPLFTPVYQDAVMAETYIKTMRVQFLQLRRWAWGASDFAFAVRESIIHREIPWSNKLVQLARLIEGHYSWSTSSLLLMFTAWLPLYLNQQFSYTSLAHNLPVITSRILMVASVSLALTIVISIILLPKRPQRYGMWRSLAMLWQWCLMPATAIVFSSFAAINAQTRLMFGKYLEFYVTDKAVKK